MKGFLDQFEGKILENESLSHYTSYRIGGKVSWMLFPKHLQDLKIASSFISNSKLPYAILSGGSNCLAQDENQKGIVLNFKEFDSQLKLDKEELTTGAGLSLFKLLRFARENSLEKFECLSGIPALVGGAVMMNAGTHLGEVKDLLQSVEVFSLRSKTTRKIRLESDSFSYRKNNFLKEHEVITLATWMAIQGDFQKIQTLHKEVLERRKSTQPLKWPSCGSVFKNPPDHKAWSLIDSAGLRGKRIGDAQISPEHTNWIINLGEAQARDVRDLIDLAVKIVFDKFGIHLEVEVKEIEWKWIK